MHKIFFIVVLMVSFSAQAAAEILECGLPDYFDTEETVVELAGGKTLEEGVELTLLQRQQVVVAARALISDEGQVEIETAGEAIRLLREWGVDAYIENFRVAGRSQIFTQVKTYPGDNPVGVIFRAGTRTIIAYNGDNSIECVGE